MYKRVFTFYHDSCLKLQLKFLREMLSSDLYHWIPLIHNSSV